mmetsp:Transcript_9278/g.22782  ORF Transcript_9278/g.22782 Transcript_9278/m.22782 type:complete len:96 (-) Transcript_9278:1747-2034(-)
MTHALHTGSSQPTSGRASSTNTTKFNTHVIMQNTRLVPSSLCPVDRWQRGGILDVFVRILIAGQTFVTHVAFVTLLLFIVGFLLIVGLIVSAVAG